MCVARFEFVCRLGRPYAGGPLSEYVRTYVRTYPHALRLISDGCTKGRLVRSLDFDLCVPAVGDRVHTARNVRPHVCIMYLHARTRCVKKVQETTLRLLGKACYPAFDGALRLAAVSDVMTRYVGVAQPTRSLVMMAGASLAITCKYRPLGWQ